MIIDEIDMNVDKLILSMKEVSSGEVVMVCLVELQMLMDTLVKNKVISTEQKNSIIRCTAEAVGRIFARYSGRV